MEPFENISLEDFMEQESGDTPLENYLKRESENTSYLTTEFIKKSLDAKEGDYVEGRLPNVRGEDYKKMGRGGLSEDLKEVKEVALEVINKETSWGYTELEVLAGMGKTKSGSFTDVEKQIKLLEENMNKMHDAINSLKIEIGWLKKMTIMKW